LTSGPSLGRGRAAPNYHSL